MRIAVVSDLHAFDSNTWNRDGSPSHYDVSNAKPPTHCPVGSLFNLIDTMGMTADILLCPGDFANHACALSLPKAWAAINEVGRRLDAGLIVGNVGNHDVDSRHIHNAYDPIESLKLLNPLFPINDRDLRNQFWSEHFFVKATDNLQLVVVNSSAYHATEAEVQHGRITSQTLKLLEGMLDSRTINILMCHHNPQKHSELLLGENDEIKGGQLLLDLISKPGRGDWLVVHGHKHHPKITYAAGGARSAVIFSAGSVASTLYPDLQTATNNQFYIIELNDDHIRSNGLIGRFESWDWHQGYGWREADAGKGLPAKGGFGHRENPVMLAHKIVASISGKRQSFLKREKLRQKFPEIQYVMPSDLKSLAYELEMLNAVLELDDLGEVSEVSLR
jgi:hypothetical protein